MFEKVRAIICEQLDLDEKDVTMQSSIVDDLGADSLELVDLVMLFEQEFDLEIPDDQIEDIKVVGDIVRYLEDHAE